MVFLSILCALVIEQFRPLRANNILYTEIKSLVIKIENWCNAGHDSHGRIGWLIAVLSLSVPILIISFILSKVSLILFFLWNVLVAYLTIGFRRYSHYFSSINNSFIAGNEAQARATLGEWIKRDTEEMESQEVIRLAIEKALVMAHHNVFGVFFWFLVFGPTGAVFYRISEYLSRAWNRSDEDAVFGRFAKRIFYYLDWIPVRLTAFAFAIVGNFEDAVYMWRNYSYRWADETQGVILSAGAGAMGILLGSVNEKATHFVNDENEVFETLEAEIILGEQPTVRSLQSAIGLIWRSLLLWMFLVLLCSIAMWVA